MEQKHGILISFKTKQVMTQRIFPLWLKQIPQTYVDQSTQFRSSSSTRLSCTYYGMDAPLQVSFSIESNESAPHCSVVVCNRLKGDAIDYYRFLFRLMKAIPPAPSTFLFSKPNIHSFSIPMDSFPTELPPMEDPNRNVFSIYLDMAQSPMIDVSENGIHAMTTLSHDSYFHESLVQSIIERHSSWFLLCFHPHPDSFPTSEDLNQSRCMSVILYRLLKSNRVPLYKKKLLETLVMALEIQGHTILHVLNTVPQVERPQSIRESENNGCIAEFLNHLQQCTHLLQLVCSPVCII